MPQQCAVPHSPAAAVHLAALAADSLRWHVTCAGPVLRTYSCSIVTSTSSSLALGVLLKPESQRAALFAACTLHAGAGMLDEGEMCA